MAQQGAQLDGAKFCCSICLDLLKDPVTIPCGHSYCMNCIKGFWDEEDEKKIHSCPQCRQTFTPRPVLMKNTMLADLVEELKKTGLQAAPADHCYAGPEDVACDVCTGRKLKALNSCLVCLVSYCEKHLQPHYDAAQLKKHKLVEATAKLQQTICPCHDEAMKMFCRTDQQCICYLCFMNEHKGHKTVSAAEERTEKQGELEVSRQRIQRRIQDREKDVKLLQQKVEAVNHSAGKAVEDSEKIFTELISFIQKRRSDVKQWIRSQQETVVSEAENLQEKLTQELDELWRKDAELEELSHTEDHIQFLQNYTSQSLPWRTSSLSDIKIKPPGVRYFEDVMAAVSEATQTIQDILSTDWTEISKTEVDVLLSNPQEEPKTRAEFLEYSHGITLDRKTVNRYTVINVWDRKASKQMKEQYDCGKTCHVLSKQALTGRYYWEVEMSGRCTVALAYKDGARAGNSNKFGFGYNDKSWALECCEIMYFFRHNSILTLIPGPQSSRVGVYLDHRAGILSFYSVSETMTLLHRVQTTFTQPLYVGLQFYDSLFASTAEFCEID